jgi:transcriptional regulator of acetoin/glycerol metabolism
MSSDHFLTLTEGDKLRPLDDVLQDVLLHAVSFCGGNKTQAADGLGMSRTTFYRKLGVLRELLSEKRKT